ncbi:MAG: twin-arginine translocation signal domain-containing protein [Chloroflexi bacterium]|nr:twin-arginine translocation signal domain-containing protein [Chloroflexota bacterium]
MCTSRHGGDRWCCRSRSRCSRRGVVQGIALGAVAGGAGTEASGGWLDPVVPAPGLLAHWGCSALSWSGRCSSRWR